MLLALLLLLPLALLATAAPAPPPAPAPALIRRQSFDMGSITSHIPSLCVAPCAPMETYWATNAGICGGVTDVSSGIGCLNTVCAKTFFDSVSACTACVLQAVPSDIVSLITSSINGVGELCRIMGFNVGMIVGGITPGNSTTTAAANATGTTTNAATTSGSTSGSASASAAAATSAAVGGNVEPPSGGASTRTASLLVLVLGVVAAWILI